MSPSTSIQLYAELLINIRTVTFFATLSSEHTPLTKAELSADGETITLSHEGETARIRLPTRIKGGGSATLSLPESPAKDLSLRLQLEETREGFLRFPGGVGEMGGGENVVPWDASTFATGKQVRCKSCGARFLGGQVRVWKDLPGEGWAEMMEFWHCHKPHEHGEEGHEHDDVQGKGYAAGQRWVVVKGTGFVDLAYMVCAEDDFEGIEKAAATETSMIPQKLACKTCGAMVGVVDEKAEGWRVFKWSMALSTADGQQESYSAEKWISAQILTAIENDAIRKFVVSSADRERCDDDRALMLWIFTPDLSISSSVGSDERQDPTRVMKVFHRTIHDSGDVIDTDTSVERLYFPEEVLQLLLRSLEKNAELLPETARRFKEWDVGLLQRFDPKAV
ncbi:hypothetical protein K402DRAFT_388723 [Aulographum hederae CBS 113979]|uniref:Ubiquitin-conjugating enzyme E2-binding protein n=1 Tax=Aulographum hederae CBS 113979 TaxID=1176131 RepID=A0A6G1HGJ3_9PEZI|nr:hypothetical protein K402DRAFT_388723 [Aulographum hederae CBS 113979]